MGMPIRRASLAAAFVAVGLVSFAAGTVAQGRYPEINRAEFALRQAMAHLQRAGDVFGGHKERAAWHIGEAVRELEEGKRWAAWHGY